MIEEEAQDNEIEIDAVDSIELSIDDDINDQDEALAVDASSEDEPEELSAKMLEMHENLSLKAQVEAAVFAAAKPLKSADLIELVSHSIGLKEMDAILESLQAEYAERDGGFNLEYVKGLGFQFQSAAAAGPLMERLFASRPRPLSRAALETLSIIAYRQPCTRAAIEFVRSVDAGSIIKNLMDRDLIRCVGRKEDAGRPMLFGTTDEFLQVFGLSSLQELPTLQSFQAESDTVREAMKELESIDEVDVEDFIGDEDEDLPRVSDGLNESNELNAQSEEELVDENEQICDESSAPEDQETLTGATVADNDSLEEYDDQDDTASNQSDQDPEMALADGDSIEARGRELD